MLLHFCYYNKIPKTGNFTNKRGLFSSQFKGMTLVSYQLMLDRSTMVGALLGRRDHILAKEATAI